MAIAKLVCRVGARTQIAAYGHARVGVLHDPDLVKTQIAAAVIDWPGGQRGERLGIAGDGVGRIPSATVTAGFLHVKEWEFALSPIATPAPDERTHQRELVHAFHGGPGLTLVPK